MAPGWRSYRLRAGWSRIRIPKGARNLWHLCFGFFVKNLFMTNVKKSFAGCC